MSFELNLVFFPSIFLTIWIQFFVICEPETDSMESIQISVIVQFDWIVVILMFDCKYLM